MKLSYRKTKHASRHYMSIQHAYDKLQPPISYQQFYKRIMAGETFDHAARGPDSPGTQRKELPEYLVLLGFKTVGEAYAALRPPISKGAFYRRIWTAFDVDDLVSPPRRKPSVPVPDRDTADTEEGGS